MSKKISELPDATLPLNDADLFEVVQGGVNKKAPKSALGGGAVESIVAGTNITVDDTDPANPIVSASGGGGSGTVESVTGTTNRIDVDNTDPDNPIIDIDAAYDAAVTAEIAAAIDTVPNGLAVANTTGVAISFAVPQIYGSVGTPETGNITIVTTGLVQGMTQLLIHNNGTEPTYGAEIQIISGTYTTGVVNYIMLMAVSSTLVLVTISQELA